ncbi:hypothetical protein NL351_29485, partial [Klebsiella pneumoniae]|nr:hypothetical protein [Klebsiella pneumoniae]
QCCRINVKNQFWLYEKSELLHIEMSFHYIKMCSGHKFDHQGENLISSQKKEKGRASELRLLLV